MWHQSLIVYYFLFEKKITSLQRTLLTLFPKLTVKIVDELSIPHPALSAPSVQERSGAERALNGISYFAKLATSEN